MSLFLNVCHDARIRKVHEIDKVATASPFRSRKGYDVTKLRKIVGSTLKKL